MKLSQKAKDVLLSDEFAEIFRERENDIKDAWASEHDKEKRESLYLGLYELNELRDYFYASAKR